MRYGALEAGGTKMVCAVGDENGKILEQKSFPTLTPEDTMPQMLDYFKAADVSALGIACFGPVGVNPGTEEYGKILHTPKIPWRGFDFMGYFRSLDIPMGIDTDVNGSLLGEATYGCAKGLSNAVYYTIGTGVGAGVMVGGKLVHGMLHPEAGHILMRIHPKDSYRGHCPSHGTCLEGMAAGPAIEERWGKSAKELGDNHDAWDIEAYYLAQACISSMMTVSPQKIILGGGVMHQTQLFPLVRMYTKLMGNGYIVTPETKDLDSYIVPASLNDDQGIMGCVRLAQLAYEGA